MKRNKFSLSNTKLLSCNLGSLVPINLMEVLPGDSVQQATSMLLRCSPLVTPVMHPVHVRLHHWYVPHRLVWDDFEDFITGGPTGTDASIAPLYTTPGGPGSAVGTLADYLGVPTGVPSLPVSALPFRGYSLIFNEWYRDQDLQTELVIDTTSGPDTTTNIALQNACWEKDYFTAARPWEQKGPSITIPLGTSAPVSGIGLIGSPALGVNASARTAPPLTTPANYPDYTNSFSGNNQPIVRVTTNVAATTRPDVYADLTNASAITVTRLREALALQRYEEARARYGSRYTEYLRYLGVQSSDARLQRPEYLGGGKQTVQFSEVLQTAEGTNPVGTLRGHGISAMRSNRYRRYFEEHGYVFTLLSVRPKTIYAQGLARHWSRAQKEDYWQEELQHIGQQEVLNKEIYAAHASPNNTFGYSDRYAEYRTIESSIAGQFRTTLDTWHFARLFGSSPALNADFVNCVPPERPFADQTSDLLWIMANHSIQARRMVASSTKSYIY